MRVRSKVWLEKDGKLSFGAGKAAILEAVERTGSLSAAARELNMSYRHAWSAIRAAETRLGRRLLVVRRGGARRGGAALTPYAKELVREFGRMEEQVKAFADGRFRRIFGRAARNRRKA